MTQTSSDALDRLLASRFGKTPQADPGAGGDTVLRGMLARGSCREFLDKPVPQGLVTAVLAAALSAPSKSDLQQRDIIVVHAPDIRQRLAALVSGQGWVAGAPLLLVFCGNNRRQRLIHDWHAVPFANDHLDAFFNAVGDAAIALGACVTAAEALGLGCCPISGLRNEPETVSQLLGLPSHVFPFAGLALGYRAAAPGISKRLPWSVTCHRDQYGETGLRAAIADYDARRAEAEPYPRQRNVEIFGRSESYGWSEDKVRQYSQSERAGFGAYIRTRGFVLD